MIIIIKVVFSNFEARFILLKIALTLKIKNVNNCVL